jgi:hypothetical protein
VAIVGDSLGRKYYFGLLAALGHPSPLVHDTAAAKHEDLRFELEGAGAGTSVAFYWRPYAKEVQAQLAQWAATPGGGVQPDALLLSFGLWDTLHETASAEVDGALKGIAEAVGRASVSSPASAAAAAAAAGRGFTAWLVPTAIVDDKLLTEEKRAHMTEKHVAAARAQARASPLVGAVDVVLDGAKVTQGLAARSEDGVHYDDGVYAALVQMGSNAYEAFLRAREEQQQPPQEDKGGKHRWQRQRRQRRRSLVVEDVADWEEWEACAGGDGGDEVGATHRVLKTTSSGTSDGGKKAKSSTSTSTSTSTSSSSSSSSSSSKEIDGSMSSPWHGAFLLVVVALMLLTMDPYAGFSWLGLCLARADAHVTWEEAYEPLLSKILRTSPASLPSSSAGSAGNSSGVVGGGAGGGHHSHSHSGVGGVGAAVRGRYTPVPQEIELGGVDQPLSPGESGPTPNEE